MNRYAACMNTSRARTLKPGAMEKPCHCWPRRTRYLGRLDEAAAWSEKAVQADSLNPNRHLFHGTVLLERDLTEEAAKAMRRAIFLVP